MPDDVVISATKAIEFAITLRKLMSVAAGDKVDGWGPFWHGDPDDQGSRVVHGFDRPHPVCDLLDVLQAPAVAWAGELGLGDGGFGEPRPSLSNKAEE